EKLFIYNVNDMIVAQQSIASPEEQAERVEALEFLLSNKTGIVLIPIAGARRLLPPKEIYQKAHLTINLDGEIELEQLMNQLVRSEEHTSELQSRFDLVCCLLLENNN